MKLFSLAVVAAATVVAADPAIVQEFDSPTQYAEAVPTADGPIAHIAATPTAELIPSETSQNISSSEYDSMPNALKQFIFEMSPKNHLELRQNAAAGGGQAGAAATPTQLSPTTVYDIGGGPMTYIQSFKSPPSQLPSPTPGSIGLGSIQGKVGQIRTYSSNPAPTAHVDSRVILAVAGGIGAGMIF